MERTWIVSSELTLLERAEQRSKTTEQILEEREDGLYRVWVRGNVRRLRKLTDDSGLVKVR